MGGVVSGIMGALALFFASSIGAIVKRALVAIGIGTITYAGIDVAFGAARDLVVANYGQITGDTAALINLAGVGATIGIILGALAARVALIALTKLGNVL